MAGPRPSPCAAAGGPAAAAPAKSTSVAPAAQVRRRPQIIGLMRSAISGVEEAESKKPASHGADSHGPYSSGRSWPHRKNTNRARSAARRRADSVWDNFIRSADRRSRGRRESAQGEPLAETDRPGLGPAVNAAKGGAGTALAVRQETDQEGVLVLAGARQGVHDGECPATVTRARVADIQRVARHLRMRCQREDHTVAARHRDPTGARWTISRPMPMPMERHTPRSPDVCLTGVRVTVVPPGGSKSEPWLGHSAAVVSRPRSDLGDVVTEACRHPYEAASGARP